MGADRQRVEVADAVAQEAQTPFGTLPRIEQLDATRGCVSSVGVEIQPGGLPTSIDLGQVRIRHVNLATNLDGRRHVVAQQSKWCAAYGSQVVRDIVPSLTIAARRT